MVRVESFAGVIISLVLFLYAVDLPGEVEVRFMTVLFNFELIFSRLYLLLFVNP